MPKKSTTNKESPASQPLYGSQAWLASLTQLTHAIGQKTFISHLTTLLQGFLHIDHCSIFTFTRNGPGHLLTCGKMPTAEAAELGRDYVNTFHARDPQLSKTIADKNKHLIHPNLQEEYDEEYRQHFFIEHQLIDKVSTVNQMNEDSVYCNYYRMTGAAPFSHAEHNLFEYVLPLISAIISQHFRQQKLSGQYDDNDDTNVARSLIRSVFDRKAKPFDCLTARETETCERILTGYTTTGISLHLGIAESSVNTYRRRAYNKLGIATQNELFSLCLSAIGKSQR